MESNHATEKRTYIPPMVEIDEFKAEAGFAVSTVNFDSNLEDITGDEDWTVEDGF